MGTKRVFPLALLGLFVLLGVSQALPGSSRIWGGGDATTVQAAHVASVRVNNAHRCSGSIISDKHILTAGHCVSLLSTTPVAPDSVTVRVGSANQYAGGQLIDVRAIAIHPSYGNFLNDLAVITLKQSLTFSNTIKKITLATEQDVYDEGTAVVVTGWGEQQSGTTPYKLQQVSMTVLSGPNCEYEAGYGYDSVICLQHPVNTGFCRGDDGAGVVSGSKLVGVASFAFGSCGTKYPDISSKVSYYYKWINGIIA